MKIDLKDFTQTQELTVAARGDKVRVVSLPRWRTREFDIDAGDGIKVMLSDKKSLRRFMVIDLGSIEKKG